MLMDTAQRLERCYTRFASYVGNDDECNIELPVDSDEEFYVVDSDDRTAFSFTLTATPQGDQTNDAKCAALTLTNAGIQGSSGTADSDDCW
jgi:type IV pilus assembly protein PilE